MMGTPRLGRMSRGICTSAIAPASITATTATITVTGRRSAARAGVIPSASLDHQVVELDHGVGLRPQAHASRVLERLVFRVQDLVAVEPDREVIASRLHLEDVPGVGRHLDVVVLEGPAPAVDGGVDREVVLVGVAPRDVVVVRVLVAPDEAESLIDPAREWTRTHREGDVLVGAVLQYGERESIVRGIGALLDEDMVPLHASFDPHD